MMSPKARYLCNPTNVAELRNLVDQPWFLDATEKALLQYQLRVTDNTGTTLETASANFHKIAGAQAFIKELMALADKPTVPQRTNSDNLAPV